MLDGQNRMQMVGVCVKCFQSLHFSLRREVTYRMKNAEQKVIGVCMRQGSAVRSIYEGVYSTDMGSGAYAK